MARARSIGSRLEVYSPEVDRFDPQQLILLSEVREALERRELVVHYQPKLQLSSGRIFGVEALVRWQHPRRGLLGPMDFVPLIEPTALVDPMTLYVVDEAARQLAAWAKVGLELELSVNLSTRNLLDVEPALWTFLYNKGVEPTNNHIERLLRPGVLWRKNAFGCHSAAGCRFVNPPEDWYDLSTVSVE